MEFSNLDEINEIIESLNRGHIYTLPSHFLITVTHPNTFYRDVVMCENEDEFKQKLQSITQQFPSYPIYEVN